MTALPWDELKQWYRQALQSRVLEVEAIGERLASAPQSSAEPLQRIARALSGSGASYRFPEVTAGAEVVELLAEREPVRMAEGLSALLRPIAWPSDPTKGSPFRWLHPRPVEGESRDPVAPAGTGLREAWRASATAEGMAPKALAIAVGRRLGVSVGVSIPAERDSIPFLPPELARSLRVVPLSFDDAVLEVATANPVDLVGEARLSSASGRRIRWHLVAPEEVAKVWGPEPSSSPEAQRPPSSPEGNRVDVGGSEVVVADDDPAIRMLVQAILDRAGFPTRAFRGGAELLAALESEDRWPRLAIVDLDMPGMNGHAVLTQIVARYGERAPRVLVFTGSPDRDDEMRALEAGAADFLSKPVNPTLLVARVRALLGG